MSKKQNKIDQRDKKISELEDKWRRALADYQNLEKRTVSDRVAFVKMANARLIEKLMEVIDDLERAAEHLKDSGVNMIVVRMLEVLKGEGLEEIKVLDQEFDPETMEAVETVAGKKNIVVTVTQKGYMIDDVVLRPAKVEVGKGSNKL